MSAQDFIFNHGNMLCTCAYLYFNRSAQLTEPCVFFPPHRWRVKVYTRPWVSWICCLTTLRNIWRLSGTGIMWPLTEDLLTRNKMWPSSTQEKEVVEPDSILYLYFVSEVLLPYADFLPWAFWTDVFVFWDFCLPFCPADKWPNHIVYNPKCAGF